MNLLANLPRNLAEEQLDLLAKTPHVRVERIVSHGHTSPPGFWYDQPQAEFVLLVQGRARLVFEDGEIELVPGDHVTIPARRRHRVAWTDPDQPTVWLAVHFDE